MFVYDADQTVGLIRMYAATGKYLRTVGAKGGGPGEYGQLNGFAVARNGDLLLWDGAGARVNRYAADGSFKSAFRIPVSRMFTANGLHVATDGTFSLSAVIGRHESALFAVPFQPSIITTLLSDGGFVGGYADRYVFIFVGAGAKPRQVIREVAPWRSRQPRRQNAARKSVRCGHPRRQASAAAHRCRACADTPDHTRPGRVRRLRRRRSAPRPREVAAAHQRLSRAWGFCVGDLTQRG